MGRSALQVKPDKLQAIVNELESTATFASIGELCAAIATSDWGKGVKNSKNRVVGISPPKVYASLREFKTELKTKAGKRGRAAGTVVERRTRETKLGNNPLLVKWKDGINKEVACPGIPDRYKNVAEHASRGNVRACVTLACSACVGYEGRGYMACTSTRCGLFPLNLLYWPTRKVAVQDGDDYKVVDAESEAAKTGVPVEITSGF